MLWLLALVLTTTPRIDEFIDACAGQPAAGFTVPRGVTAPADGVVRVAEADRVELTHCFIENHQVRVVRSVFTGLHATRVKVNDQVTRGQLLGAGRRVQSTIDEFPAATFVKGRERLLVPRLAPVLVVVDVDAHVATRFAFGAPTHTWDVGHGQVDGEKEARGDLKTPRGLYFVVHRSTGPFSGAYADYFGDAWVKLNYPNAFDAARGLDAGLITAPQADTITRQWQQRRLTLQGTALGGGIGFHGWNAPWDGGEGYGKSWGCVVLHPEDIKQFHDVVPEGTPVVLR